MLLKKPVFKNHIYQKGVDKLFPYVFAYIPVALIFSFVFEEVPVKFFFHDDYDPPKPPGPSPQAPVVDMKRLYPVGYNFVILAFCLVVIVRHFIIRKKITRDI